MHCQTPMYIGTLCFSLGHLNQPSHVKVQLCQQCVSLNVCFKTCWLTHLFVTERTWPILVNVLLNTQIMVAQQHVNKMLWYLFYSPAGNVIAQFVPQLNSLPLHCMGPFDVHWTVPGLCCPLTPDWHCFGQNYTEGVYEQIKCIVRMSLTCLLY